MKSLLFSSTALVAFVAGNVAEAADLAVRMPVKAPIAAVLPFNWTGFYVGAVAGYSWRDPTIDFAGNGPAQALLAAGVVPRTVTVDPHGFLGGAQAGYNFQSGPWVFGIEGDLQATGASDTFAPWKFSNPWFGTVRGRGGYAFNNIFFYGTAGLAFGELIGQTFGVSENHTNVGWTVGLGAEFGLTPNWSAKAEFLFIDLNDSNFTITGLPNGYHFGLLRAGVNYRF